MLYELILINEIEQRAKIFFLSVALSSFVKLCFTGLKLKRTTSQVQCYTRCATEHVY